MVSSYTDFFFATTALILRITYKTPRIPKYYIITPRRQHYYRVRNIYFKKKNAYNEIRKKKSSNSEFKTTRLNFELFTNVTTFISQHDSSEG